MHLLFSQRLPRECYISVRKSRKTSVISGILIRLETWIFEQNAKIIKTGGKLLFSTSISLIWHGRFSRFSQNSILKLSWSKYKRFWDFWLQTEFYSMGCIKSPFFANYSILFWISILQYWNLQKTFGYVQIFSIFPFFLCNS